MKRALVEPSDALRVSAVSDSLIPIQLFVPPPSAIICRTFNEHTGAIVNVSLKQYLFDGEQMFHHEFALVLYGDGSVGKTPVAMTLCSLMARIHQHES